MKRNFVTKSSRSRINTDVFFFHSFERRKKKNPISLARVLRKGYILILPVVYERDFLNSHYFTAADTIVDRTIRSFHKDPVPDLIVFSAFAHKSGTV